ncbi:MAG: elongation factor G [Bacteroidetes bacterium GWF2_33_16]|nr:MAG: elongation factor G [Bacteroidetes bacterium GWE2_32_14]OFY08920.1 MAG: elongation factor G [Bacteroidetes bacterium GWF2_33_16]
MKTYQTDKIRNIALIGSSGSGKTTLAEAILLEGGVIERKGSVNAKNTVSDYNEIEHEAGNSVFSTVLYTEFNDHKINIIDTPGADDYSGGVISSYRVVDTAILLLHAQHGIEVGTEIHYRHCEKHNKPLVIVINQLDHEKANYERTLEAAKTTFGSKVVVVQYPIGSGSEFSALIDVLKMKMYKWDASGKREELAIPADQMATAEELHNTLVEAAAENDEKLMELFFEKGSLNEDEMRKGIAAGLINRGLFPVFCTSAEKSMGIKRLLEFAVNALPSPDKMPEEVTVDGKKIVCKEDGPTALFVFKSATESHIGEINYFKVISGKVSEGMDLTNNNTGSKERLSQLYVVAGKNRQKVTQLSAGDIGAAVKLKNTGTNETLSDSKATMKFPPITFPNPKYRTAIKAVSESDDEKLGEALGRINQADPTIIIEYSKELKQILIHGQGEYHLNNMVKWHLDKIYKIETEFLPPRIPYRETITKVAESSYRHKKQSGGSGQFGEVHIVIEPFKEGAPEPSKYKVGGKEIAVSVRNKEEHNLPWGGKLVYYNCIVGGAIDARFLPAILKGIMEKMEEGPLTGSYARDIRVCVYDGKMHPVDSNEISFRLAGRNAFRAAFKEAGPKIMEPIYDVEVLVPSDRMGDVMSDLQGRRAMIEGMSSEKGFEKINAKVPLAEMNKYSTALSSVTGGRATYTMKFAKYDQVPMEVQEKLIKAFEAEEEEE